jgi:hypothetical protein
MVLGLLKQILPSTYVLVTRSQFPQPSFLEPPNFNRALILRLDVMSFSAVDGHHKVSRKGWHVIKERKDILGAVCDIRLLAVVTNRQNIEHFHLFDRKHEFELDHERT